MLEASFLGHQGWLLSAGRTHVLVDPLLTEGFGHGGLAGRVWPPRAIDLEAMPPIDAVVITHEHDDHFDIPSLCSVDRETPVYLSSRSSGVMHAFVESLGFSVRLLQPQGVHAIGDLRYETFVADHRRVPRADEWDVFPFIVSDAQGQGAFVSCVDVVAPTKLLQSLASHRGWPGLLCLANNVTDARFAQHDVTRLRGHDDTDALVPALARRLEAVSDVAGPPGLAVVTGGGWSHPPPLSWLDAVAFPIDSNRLCTAVQQRSGVRCLAAIPGITVTQRSRESTVSQAEFVRPDPREYWPDRTPRSVDVPELAPPATRRACSDAELDRLVEQLGDFARHLYASPTFVGLHSASDIEPLRPTLAWWLAREQTAVVVEYRQNECRFVRTDVPDPPACHLAGYRAWASDVLGLLEGRIGPTALCYTGRLRCWNGRPDLVRVSPHDVWMFAHPLRRPRAAERLYERLRDASDQRPRLRASSRSPDQGNPS